MSYILEALKKSEQERERGDVPDIKSVHKSDKAGMGSASRSVWTWFLAVVILINGAIFAVIYLDEEPAAVAKAPPRRAPATSQQPDQPLPAADQPSTPSQQTADGQKGQRAGGKAGQDSGPRVVFSNKPLDTGEPVDDTQRQQAPDDKEPAPVSVSGSGASAGEKAGPAARLSELPDNIRRQIPSIAFGGHIYSSSVERRSVMINGKKRREGESLGSGLMLTEITPRGAEFEFQGYRFRLNALQDWSYQ